MIIAALAIVGIASVVVWGEVTAARSQRRARAAQLRVESHIRLRSYDACEVCHGVKGGVPGNENVMYGSIICCDDCCADGSVERYLCWKARQR